MVKSNSKKKCSTISLRKFKHYSIIGTIVIPVAIIFLKEMLLPFMVNIYSSYAYDEYKSSANTVSEYTENQMFLKIKPKSELLNEISESLTPSINSALEEYDYGYKAYNEFLFEIAITHFKKALNLIKIPSFYISLGNAYAAMSNKNEAIECFQKAIELSKNFKTMKSNEISALGCIGNVFFSAYQFNEAMKYYQDVLILAKDKKELQAEEASALGSIGMVYISQSNFKKALVFIKKSASIFEEINDENGKSIAQSNMANCYVCLNDFDSALKYYNYSLLSSQKHNNKLIEANNLLNIGNIYKYKNDINSSMEYYEKAHNLYEEINYVRGEAQSLNNIALIYMLKSEFSLAYNNHFRALKFYEEIGHQNGIAVSNRYLGDYYTENKNRDYDKALEHYNKSLAIFQNMNNQDAQATIFYGIANVFFQKKDNESAINYYNKALAIYRDRLDFFNEANVLGNEGSIYYEKNDFSNALDFNLQALSIYEKHSATDISCKREMANGLFNIGLIYCQFGDLKKAEYNFIRAYKTHKAIDKNYNAHIFLMRIIKNGTTELVDKPTSKKALNFFNLALSMAKYIDDSSNYMLELQGDIYVLIGDFLVNEGEYKNGVTNYSQALKLYNICGNNDKVNDTLESLRFYSIYLSKTEWKESVHDVIIESFWLRLKEFYKSFFKRVTA